MSDTDTTAPHDIEPPNYEMGPPSEAPDIGAICFEAAVEAMVEWFRANFEDPAENLPYESAEGGYQWIWGGPCDAAEELADAFGDTVEKMFGDMRAVDAAADEIGWGLDWAPSASRMRPVYDNATLRVVQRLHAEVARLRAEVARLTSAVPA